MTEPTKTVPAGRPLDRLVRDPALRCAIEHWDALRGHRMVPPRLALDPAELRPVLHQCAILENPRPGTVRIRLAGARISAFMGMEARGMPLRALFDLADRGRITAEAELALAGPGILLIEAFSPAPRYGFPASESLRTQIALLPMSDPGEAVTRALLVVGAADPRAKAPPEPQRWSVERVERIGLRIGVPVLSNGAPRRPTPEVPRHADEAATETRGALARARFRIIRGGLA
ncbi:PAS domain-containing protein [Roseicyclus sp.]|uniref:PAS domain-containing protein n=1 Tax=Roseicyclus sp. TaxID=1914329 RepID=UPI003FA07DFF